MKNVLTFTLFLFSGLLSNAFGQKKAIYTHSLPQGLIDSVQKVYVEKFEKGRILYQLSCASCHNKIVDSVEVMPDFPHTKLAGYVAGSHFPAHEETTAEMKVTAEEIDKIMFFITKSQRVDLPAKRK